jgi:hypothetical protein
MYRRLTLRLSLPAPRVADINVTTGSRRHSGDVTNPAFPSLSIRQAIYSGMLLDLRSHPAIRCKCVRPFRFLPLHYSTSLPISECNVMRFLAC